MFTDFYLTFFIYSERTSKKIHHIIVTNFIKITNKPLKTMFSKMSLNIYYNCLFYKIVLIYNKMFSSVKIPSKITIKYIESLNLFVICLTKSS